MALLNLVGRPRWHEGHFYRFGHTRLSKVREPPLIGPRPVSMTTTGESGCQFTVTRAPLPPLPMRRSLARSFNHR